MTRSRLPRSFVFWSVVCMAGSLGAQERPRPARVGEVAAVIRGIQADGVRLGGSIWPGFRPDTIPFLVTIDDGGAILFGWPSPPPAGMVPMPGLVGAYLRRNLDPAAANTSIELGDRRVAQLTAGRLDSAALRGLAVHEAFHVFQGGVARDDRRFGRGENSFLVTQYPIFDRGNEAGFYLELELLAEALAAERDDTARARAREYVAAREFRHRRLAPTLAEFETLAELNEGLAEYALIRAQFAEPRLATEHLVKRIESLPGTADRSVRLRFYATGAATAMLLDRLAGPAWKDALIAENRTLQDALAEATGARDEERRLLAAAVERHADREIEARAGAAIAALETRRRAQMDSLLHRPGLALQLVLIGRPAGLCGIDPQNLLPVGEGIFLHTRWVRLCAGNRIDGEFLVGSVEDRPAGAWRAVIGPAEQVSLRAGGRVVTPGPEAREWSEVELTAPGARFRFATARIQVVEGKLRITVP